MFKKIITAILTFTIMFSPVGNSIVHDQQTVSAKGYKSGIKKYRSGGNNQYQKQNPTFNKKYNYSKKSNYRSTRNRGFMRGMLYGGLAGFLIGGLLNSLGPFGAIVGLGINLLGIFVLFLIIRRVLSSMRRNRY
ncbi:hypothetical protein [Bacillus massilinigeriensis]|uniref:hypothetical protein n=1 Tax=Bacillus massilionigeriensis TaxID=1805475 RepID=UPI00096B21B2|nr:hypothetical protein [Bacillus massilionigeriensis]